MRSTATITFLLACAVSDVAVGCMLFDFDVDPQSLDEGFFRESQCTVEHIAIRGHVMKRRYLAAKADAETLKRNGVLDRPALEALAYAEYYLDHLEEAIAIMHRSIGTRYICRVTYECNPYAESQSDPVGDMRAYGFLAHTYRRLNQIAEATKAEVAYKAAFNKSCKEMWDKSDGQCEALFQYSSNHLWREMSD